MKSTIHLLLALAALATAGHAEEAGTQASGDVARNVAPLAAVTASSEHSADYAARFVTDGKVAEAGSKDDLRQSWVAARKNQPTDSLTFTWNEPTPVATVVYYARAAWDIEGAAKDYAIYLDDATEPAVKGAFRRGFGPQLVNLPQAVRARKLVVQFLSRYGGPSVSAAEVQIFTQPPATALIGSFSPVELDIRYAYFPSHDLVRVLVPQPPADAKEWHLAVRAADRDKILAERGGPLPMSPAGENLPVPSLPEGKYRMTFTFNGGAKPVVEERGFQRNHYDWEGRKLGLDDVVVPPFEPLAADPNNQSVSCVLRQHAHGGAGLWKQVTSQGRPLLAGPIRLEATSGGKTTVANGAGATFTTVKATCVAGGAEWSAGALKGRTEFTYDYDGMMRVMLHLSPSAAEIERLQLVIPLKASEAWLMHPVTDQLRHHYAGRIPAGQGKVWDSLKVARVSLPGPFVPYLFVGGPERGICYAADNDRDWITDPKVPALEIDRDGETVNLRLNLVARPARLSRERTIVFALQATPAKPMPEQPYHWRRWSATPTSAKQNDVNFNLWGMSTYWGARWAVTSVYPAFMDFGFWEQLGQQRRTGKEDKEYAQKWFARFADLPEKTRAEIEPAMRAGLQWSSYTPANTTETKKFRYVFPYLSARSSGFENRDFITTYLDEWQTADVADPRWGRVPRAMRLGNSMVWYEIEPVGTFADMLLFYHRKMYETFADGIYWDNFFLSTCYVPTEAGGPAYLDDEGRLRPGVNLMAFRNLVRRNAVMMHQMGKRPLAWIHMTNANIIPMLSFGTISFDWEWHDVGKEAFADTQDRLGADRDTALILAQSLGLQAGNISVVLDNCSQDVRDWHDRTTMAVCLPHEIMKREHTKGISFVQPALADFGYGQSDCKVYRYWEDGFPLTATGAKIHALVLSRGPKVLLAIGNYGKGEDVATQTQSVSQPGSAQAYDAEREAGNKGQPAPAKPAAEREVYTVTLKLDLKALGLPETVRAHDVEQVVKARAAAKTMTAKKAGEMVDEPAPPPSTGELKRIAPGVFELKIQKHDFALVSVE